LTGKKGERAKSQVARAKDQDFSISGDDWTVLGFAGKGLNELVALIR